MEELELETKNTEPVTLIEGPQKVLTPIEIRKLRKLCVTRHLPKVKGCGHKLDLEFQPTKRNCEFCWFAWFQNHGEICKQLNEMHTAGADNIIIELQGKKFLHRYLQFMSTLAQWQKVSNIEKENNNG